jgi:hypothetical protein
LAVKDGTRREGASAQDRCASQLKKIKEDPRPRIHLSFTVEDEIGEHVEIMENPGVGKNPARNSPGETRKARSYRLKQAERGRDQVFISYSHKDQAWLEELLTLLKPLVRNGTVKLWSDRDVQPGQNWRRKIDEALASAKVAVLLVTHHYLASDFIVEYELSNFLAAQKLGLSIVWVAVGPSLYMETPLQDLQAANDPRHPLNMMSRSAAILELLSIAHKIKKLATTPAVHKKLLG